MLQSVLLFLETWISLELFSFFIKSLPLEFYVFFFWLFFLEFFKLHTLLLGCKTPRRYSNFPWGSCYLSSPRQFILVNQNLVLGRTSRYFFYIPIYEITAEVCEECVGSAALSAPADDFPAPRLLLGLRTRPHSPSLSSWSSVCRSTPSTAIIFFFPVPV